MLNNLKKFAALALAVPLAVSLSACGGGNDTPESGAPSGSEQPSKTAQVPAPGDTFVISNDQAKEIFGTSDRNGTDSADMYAIVMADDGVAWGSVMADQKEQAAKVAEAGEPFQGTVADGQIAVRESRYTPKQIRTALDAVEAIGSDKKLTFVYGYSPKDDAIQIGGPKQSLDAFEKQIEGVDLVFQEGEISEDTGKFIPAESAK